MLTTGREADGDNYLYTNEPEGVFTADGQRQEAFLESSEFDTTPPSYGPGDSIIYLDRIVPDFTINDGGQVTMKMKLKRFPNGTVREKVLLRLHRRHSLYEHEHVVDKLFFVYQHQQVEQVGD